MSFEKIIKKLEKWKKKKAFIFIPSPVLSEKESFYMPVIDVVYLENHDIYSTGYGDSIKYRIKFVGLSKLSVAANMVWDSEKTDRTDKVNDKSYAAYKAVAGIRQADGSVLSYGANKDVDLDNLQEELIDSYNGKWGKNHYDCRKKFKTQDDYVSYHVRRDMIQARKNKLTKIESGAKSRVIRFLLGVQHETNDINKFLRPHVMVSYVVNYSLKEVRGVILGALPNAMNAIYGQRQPEVIEYNDLEVIDAEHETIEPEIQPENEQPDKELIDFQNSSIEIQTQTLLDVCDEKNLDFTLESQNTEPSDHDQDWRDGFFKHLKDK